MIANMVRTKTGKVRPVCEFCGKLGRAVEPDSRGRIGIIDLAGGWSVAPYPPGFEHGDGSTGDLFECGACWDGLRAEGSLAPHPDRVAARTERALTALRIG